MKKELQKEKVIISIILCITGMILIIDTILAQFFDRGTYANNLAIIYCITFIIASLKYKNIISKKYVIIPLYLMIIQTFYSLIIK